MDSLRLEKLLRVEYNFTEEDLVAFFRFFEYRKIKKNQGYKIGIGRTSNIIYVNNGLLMTCSLVQNRKKIVHDFTPKGNFLIPMNTLVKVGNLERTIVALTTTVTIEFPFRYLCDQARENPRIKLLLDSLQEEKIRYLAVREMELICLNAKERYVAFRNRYPESIEKIRQTYVSQYINVNPVTLSRIKNSMP